MPCPDDASAHSGRIEYGAPETGFSFWGLRDFVCLLAMNVISLSYYMIKRYYISSKWFIPGLKRVFGRPDVGVIGGHHFKQLS